MSSSATPFVGHQEFLDDLQHLVNEPPRAPDPDAACDPLDALDALLGGDNADGLAGREGETPGRVATMWPDHFEEQQHRATRVERPERPLPFAVTAMIVFVCAATGAGIAALVFHDRAAQLLDLLTR
jgi:hypothetical protein